MKALKRFSTMVCLKRVSFESAHSLQTSFIVWANNGDMISRMYAGTSALKGDFTRYVMLSLR